MSLAQRRSAARCVTERGSVRGRDVHRHRPSPGARPQLDRGADRADTGTSGPGRRATVTPSRLSRRTHVKVLMLGSRAGRLANGAVDELTAAGHQIVRCDTSDRRYTCRGLAVGGECTLASTSMWPSSCPRSEPTTSSTVPSARYAIGCPSSCSTPAVPARRPRSRHGRRRPVPICSMSASGSLTYDDYAHAQAVVWIASSDSASSRPPSCTIPTAPSRSPYGETPTVSG